MEKSLDDLISKLKDMSNDDFLSYICHLCYQAARDYKGLDFAVTDLGDTQDARRVFNNAAECMMLAYAKYRAALMRDAERIYERYKQ